MMDHDFMTGLFQSQDIAENLKHFAQNVKNTVVLFFINMSKDGWNMKKLFLARLPTNNFCHAEQILSVK